MDGDIRDTDELRRNRVLEEIEQACTRIAAKRKVKVQVARINAERSGHVFPAHH